jgi:hypothetical protein
MEYAEAGFSRYLFMSFRPIPHFKHPSTFS